MTTTSLLTDHYELTMLQAALAHGTADRQCTFEAFARRLPGGRRYGVVAGVARVIDAVHDFRFSDDDLEFLAPILDTRTRDYLANYRFDGDIVGYPEGELYFPYSPVLTVTGSFASAVMLETVILSILNHDCAIATAASRMVAAANGRTIIEMGSRRTHEVSAIAAARSAYIAGFTATSNLEAGRQFSVPTTGTAAHSFTLLHDSEEDAFRAQVESLGTDTTLLVDTYDITAGIATAIAVAGPQLGAIRIDSGDLGVLARQARTQLDELGATSTKIVLSGDLDEFSIAALRGDPVDAYGVGTQLVTGSGFPTANMVYKLVEVDGRTVKKRSVNKTSHGGRKSVIRRHRATGTATEELVFTVSGPQPAAAAHDEIIPVPLMEGGKVVAAHYNDLAVARARLAARLVSLPWEGLSLTKGEPAIPTTNYDGR